MKLYWNLLNFLVGSWKNSMYRELEWLSETCPEYLYASLFSLLSICFRLNISMGSLCGKILAKITPPKMFRELHFDTWFSNLAVTYWNLLRCLELISFFTVSVCFSIEFLLYSYKVLCLCADYSGNIGDGGVKAFHFNTKDIMFTDVNVSSNLSCYICTIFNFLFYNWNVYF